MTQHTNPVYEHKGVKIELALGSGEFHATIDGRLVTKPSLAAMKKVIDGGNKDRSVYDPPLTALLWRPNDEWVNQKPYSERPIDDFRTQVRRIVKNRAHRYSSTSFKFEDERGCEHAALIQDTPEAFAALKAYYEHEEHAQKVRAELEQRSRELSQAVPLIKAGEEAQRKGMK